MTFNPRSFIMIYSSWRSSLSALWWWVDGICRKSDRGLGLRLPSRNGARRFAAVCIFKNKNSQTHRWLEQRHF